MADFRDLDPHTRCFALVGQFLQAWSVMERSLQNAIGAALSIETTKLQILCANMRFRDKINILGSLIDVANTFSEEEKTTFRKTLRDLGEYSPVRNMMAHDPFSPDSSQKGVEFQTVKAKLKFALPQVIWNVEKFQLEGATVDRYRLFLDAMEGRFLAQPLPPQNYSAAIRPFLYEDWSNQSAFLPMSRPMPPVLADLLSRQTRAAPDSSPDPTSSETSAQTPPEPEE